MVIVNRLSLQMPGNQVCALNLLSNTSCPGKMNCSAQSIQSQYQHIGARTCREAIVVKYQWNVTAVEYTAGLWIRIAIKHNIHRPSTKSYYFTSSYRDWINKPPTCIVRLPTQRSKGRKDQKARSMWWQPSLPNHIDLVSHHSRDTI